MKITYDDDYDLFDLKVPLVIGFETFSHLRALLEFEGDPSEVRTWISEVVADALREWHVQYLDHCAARDA